MNKVYGGITILLSLFPLLVFSQKPIDTVKLKGVDIVGETEFKGIKRMSDVDGPIIIAGKKNEVIEKG